MADGWAEGLGFLYAVDDSLRNEALVAAVDNDDRRCARRLRPPYLIEHPPIAHRFDPHSPQYVQLTLSI